MVGKPEGQQVPSRLKMQHKNSPGARVRMLLLSFFQVVLPTNQSEHGAHPLGNDLPNGSSSK